MIITLMKSIQNNTKTITIVIIIVMLLNYNNNNDNNDNNNRITFLSCFNVLQNTENTGD